MCGRYVLSMRYGEVRRVLGENGLSVDDFYDDASQHDATGGDGGVDKDAADGCGEAGHDHDGHGGDAIFQPSYNFAPGYYGIVIRPVADRRSQEVQAGAALVETATPPPPASRPLQMQVMRWGLVPSWTRRRPDYATMLKTINCRADALARGHGLWARLRGRRRCVVVAEGFYEWLHKGPGQRVPHYVRRRDGRPLLLAGLWDSVRFGGVRGGEGGRDGNNDDGEGHGDGHGDDHGDGHDDAPDAHVAPDPLYTYTIITTDSSPALRFLHDRMPVVFDYGSRALQLWLDAGRDAWSDELQALLRPWTHADADDGAALLVDAVSQDVNKTGRSSPRFIVPAASAHNKANIANFFAAGKTGQTKTEDADGGADAGADTKTLTVPATPPAKRTHSPADTTPSPKKARVAAAATGRAKLPSVTGKTAKRQAGKTTRGLSQTAAGSSSPKITAFFGRQNA